MTKACPVCGKEFTSSVEGHAGRTKLCCSSECKWKRINRLRHGLPVAETEYRALCEKRKAARLTKLRRVCPVCGKAFVTVPTHLGAKYCSIACANRARTGIYHAATPAAKMAAVPVNAASLANSDLRVREYLSLPDAERYQRRGTLSQAELKMAEKMWNQMHGLRTV